MLRGNARNAYEMGFDTSQVAILRNGKILEFTKDGMHETDQYVSKKLITVDGRMVGYTTEKELHDRFQIASQGVVVVAISKKSGGYHIKYDTVGLPPVSVVPGLERHLDASIREALKDLSKFKDADAFTRFVERKVGDIILHDTAKEPKVIVVVQ